MHDAPGAAGKLRSLCVASAILPTLCPDRMGVKTFKSKPNALPSPLPRGRRPSNARRQSVLHTFCFTARHFHRRKATPTRVA